MKVFTFFKKIWPLIIFLILIGGVLILREFYDVKVMVLKKNRMQVSFEEKELAKRDNSEKIISQTELKEIPVDLKNLNEEETKTALAYLKFKRIKAAFFPTGTPDVYGQELNISFDQVQDAINKVAIFDPTYGQKKITLAGNDLKRYIEIGSKISCEFCCGAKTLVFENGEAACGCDHSQMMRGLTAYLIKKHPEISNEDILKELKKWKITFFPKQTLTAHFRELEKAGEPGIKEILEEFPEFLPQMVGGC